MLEDWALLKARLSEFQADPLTILRELSDLQDRCQSGIIQEKVSAKDGVLEVVERYPQIELSIIKEKMAIFKYVEEQVQATEASRDINVNVTITALEGETIDPAQFYDAELDA